MDLKESLNNYIVERMMTLPDVGDRVCLSDKYKEYYSAKTKIYGEVIRIDKSARVAKVSWDVKHVLPISIPTDHLKIDESSDDMEDDEDMDDSHDRIQGSN